MKVKKVLIFSVIIALSVLSTILFYKYKMLSETVRRNQIKVDSLHFVLNNVVTQKDRNLHDDIIDLKNKVLENGDTLAIARLNIEYLDRDMFELFYYKLILANKYKSRKACYSIYQDLTSSAVDNNSKINLMRLDSLTQVLAITYLKLAARYGEENAIREVKELNINVHR